MALKPSSPQNDKTEISTTAEAEVAKAYQDSLLDSLRASYEQNKEYRCTRVLYIGHLTSTKQKELIEEIHLNFIESVRANQEISGAFLFINNNLFYHMLEVECLESLQPLFNELIYESSNDFFQNIDMPPKQNQSKLHPELEHVDIKICSVSEEITREFPMWSLREVELPGGKHANASNDEKGKSKQGQKSQKQANDEHEEEEVEEDEASLQAVLFETMKGMIEIGRQLCMKHDTDAAFKLFQSSQREIINRFPTPDKIEFFLESKLLFDLKGFKQYFFTPIDIKLESEFTWPIEPMISF